jgi:dienelactone hydrolase
MPNTASRLPAHHPSPQPGAPRSGHPPAIASATPDPRRVIDWVFPAAFLAFTGSVVGVSLASSWGVAGDAAAGVAVGAVIFGLAYVILAALGSIIRRLRGYVTTRSWAASLAFHGVLVVLVGLPPLMSLLLVTCAALTLGATWAAGAVVVGALRARTLARVERTAVTVMTLGLFATTAIASWLVTPGTDAHMRVIDAGATCLLDLPDPSTPGTYGVATTSYGSGSHPYRSEYGVGADHHTGRFDGSAMLPGLARWQAGLRERYWGFALDALPLNALVWHPEGIGPFPLVLIVHGNHNMLRASDQGYGWLAHHLAGRGFIVASVDQNFLNGAPLLGNLPNENDARALHLLEHVRLWRAWNADPGSPFFGRVDLGKVALIGHSRGGEAAALAAAYDRLSHHPGDARVTFDHGFGIRSVVAIAPSDGQSRPADRLLPLHDVDYLVLQGGHDADSIWFQGDRQYQRVSLAGDGDSMKASVYLHGANHGQFNTVWGRRDAVAPMAWLLNTRPLMDAGAQRQAGMVFITAFLEASLRGADGYRSLFRDHRRGAHWLPATTYLTRYQDASFRVVSDFEEDIDVTTASVGGGRSQGERLALWREGDIRMRGGVRRFTHAVTLGWATSAAETPPVYGIALPPDAVAGWALDGDAALSFDMAVIDARSPMVPAERDDPASPAGAVDFTIELVDEAGVVASVPLSSVRPPIPPLPIRFTKLALLDAQAFGAATEPLLQTFTVPLARFVGQVPEFDPARVSVVRFRFDRGQQGVIVLDDIGFARDGTGAAWSRP